MAGAARVSIGWEHRLTSGRHLQCMSDIVTPLIVTAVTHFLNHAKQHNASFQTLQNVHHQQGNMHVFNVVYCAYT